MERGLAVRPSFPDIGFHMLVAVFCADVAVGSEQHLDFLIGRAQDCGEF